MKYSINEPDDAGSTESFGSYNGVPSYLVASDTHNIGNLNDSFLDRSIDNLSSVGKFVTTSMVSGVNQVYNIVPSIGNVLGGDFELSSTADALESFDSDLSLYYKQHQDSADTVGFVLGSIVPGMAGVKILNAGQTALKGAVATGRIGGNLGKAVGLLTPSQPTLLKEAISAVVTPNAAISIWQPATIKAIAGAFTQNTLESAAATLAVEATMFKSPVLDKQDAGDIASNVLYGSILGGVIGGVVGSTGIISKINRSIRDVGAEAAPYTVRVPVAETSKASDKILLYADDALQTPKPAPELELAAKFSSLRESKLRNIDVDIRKEYGALAGGDEELASMWYSWHKSTPADIVENNLYGTKNVARLSEKLPEEKFLEKFDPLTATPEDIARYKSTSIGYVKNYGEGAGAVTNEAPRVFGIADTLKKGVSYSDAVASYKQGLKTIWNPAETSPLAAEARYVTAMKTQLKGTEVIAANDIPYLQAAYEQGVLPTVKTETGEITFQSIDEFKNFVLGVKQDVATELAKTGKLNNEEIAKIVDTSQEYLNGTRKFDDKNAFAMRDAAEEYTTRLKKAGVLKEDAPSVSVWELPLYTKSVKDVSGVQGVNGMVVDAMTLIKQQQRLYAQQADMVASSILGNSGHAPISDKDIFKANVQGPGGGLLTSQNGNYGSLGSKVQYNGAQTLKAIELERAGFMDSAAPVTYALRNSPEAAVEFSVLNNKLRSIPEDYVLRDGQLRLAKIVRYEEAIASGAENVKPPVVANDIPHSIEIKNPETYNAFELHVTENGKNIEGLSKIRANQGLQFHRDAEAVYPIPANPKDYKFYAFVVDDSIKGTFGRSKMLHATSAENLEAQMTAVRQADPTLKVLTGKDAEGYYKAIGQYDYERTLTDTSFDAALQRKGVSANYLPATDPEKIVNEFEQWHLARKSNLVREAVLHKYEPQVQMLMKLGDEYSKISRSHYTAIDALSYVENVEKNPFADYVKTLIGVSTSKEYPFWSPLNDLLDRKVSGIFNKVYEAFSNAKTPQELEGINKMLMDSGYQGAYYDAATVALANHTAPKEYLTGFIRKANSIIATLQLRLDSINAINNVIGSNVLLGTETKSVIRAIESGNADAAGELAELAKIKVPGTGESILSPGRLISNSWKNFWSPEGKEFRATLKERGLITSLSDQYNDTLSTLALKGNESPAALNSIIDKATKLAKTGEKLTGNTIAEEFNRFVAADVMRQITDVGVKHGILEPQEAWSYINTFVNRTQGNFLAAQRPGLFQGPVGQAVGLFQSYQFNLLQQLFRYVGEGQGKDAISLLGLQGTIYGMNGLPAFNAINTHVIGTASGNTEHRDAYDVVYGGTNKEIGNWLMYGLGSNVWGLIDPDLAMNLYTRGDINPRNVTVIPTALADVPFINATGKMFGAIKQTFANVQNGGDVWGSFLQGIEHSGINRPLAGLAQTLQATNNPYTKSYSTSSKGNVIASNDLLSLANLTRLAGAKPLDEAIAIDRSYAVGVYQAKDADARKELGQAIKTTVIAGKQPTRDQIDGFVDEFVKRGGKQTEFNKFFMQQYTAANTSQANKIKEHLSTPYAQSMQRIMGGYDLQDFTNGDSK
jgi:hypothetical protein